MKKTNNKKTLSVILSFVLIVVMALSMSGCTNNQTNVDVDTTSPSTSEQKAEPTILGEGAVQFSFSVTHKDGSVAEFTIKTDKATVGEALLDLKLIDGEDGQYGLYVKTVDGEALDYDTDGMYWAFYENGAYAVKGVDLTEITTDAKYEFRAEK